MRGCKMMMKLAITIGKTQNRPQANGPMLWLAVVTIATQTATVAARQARSEGVMGIFVVLGPSVANLRAAGIVSEKTTALSKDALSGVQATACRSAAQMSQTAMAPPRLAARPCRCASPT